ncbi:TIGR02186 family protein [Rhodoplanes roseus]|uniref:TIGR02186 family protein n=1 Tax=Rhodoplanes roseus TaxID=29409 RepID=UPI003CCAA7BA
MLVVALAAALPALAGGAQAAERLVTSLSTHRVLINSVFTGAEVVLFGAVESDGAGPARRGGFDVIATVVGPRQTLKTLRKDRALGIWINVDSRTFIDVPAYLAVLGTRPFDQILPQERLRRLQIGLRNVVLPQQIGPDVADVVTDDPFRQAFLRLKTERKLYVEEPTAITMLSPTLFQASIPIPAEAPVGTYEVDVKLFHDGALVTRSTSAFEITKVGFERFVATAAVDDGLIYGIVTAMMALMTGWLASVVFRRD